MVIEKKQPDEILTRAACRLFLGFPLFALRENSLEFKTFVVSRKFHVKHFAAVLGERLNH